jgi:flagellar protein FliJ
MAKKFKLQSVLNYRQSLEDQARQLLADSMQRRQQHVEVLQQHQERWRQLADELEVRQREGLGIAEIELFEGQLAHRRRLIQAVSQQLELLEREIQQQRAELLLASQEKQVMEKLKAKQEAEYRRELARKEREILDEISLRNKGDGT